MKRSMHCATALAVIAGALVAAPAEAQIGRLGSRLKDAAAAAVGGGSPAAAQAGPASRGPRYSQNVLEITPELLERVESIATADAEEGARRRQREAAEAEARGRREAYDACSESEGDRLTHAAEALAERYQAKAMSGDTKAIQILTDSMQILQQQAMSGVQQKCGPLPSGRPGAPEPTSSRHDRLAAQRLTDVQYGIVSERVVAFCGSSLAASATGAVQVPGDGRDIFYVYGAGEVEAIRPRCADLAPLLRGA